jgi:hypothetical protein
MARPVVLDAFVRFCTGADSDDDATPAATAIIAGRGKICALDAVGMLRSVEEHATGERLLRRRH